MGVVYGRGYSNALRNAMSTLNHQYIYVLRGTLIKGSGYTILSQNVPKWIAEVHAV